MERAQKVLHEVMGDDWNDLMQTMYERKVLKAMVVYAKEASASVTPVMRSLPSKLDVDDYTIQSYHSKTQRNSIWIENKLGEGMEIRLDELWKEKF